MFYVRVIDTRGARPYGSLSWAISLSLFFGGIIMLIVLPVYIPCSVVNGFLVVFKYVYSACYQMLGWLFDKTNRYAW